MSSWERCESPLHDHNFRLDAGEFYISYNPRPGAVIPVFISDNGVDETALVWKKPWKCLIINGDWRKEYEALVPKGYQACLDFYHSKSEFRSSWSED